MRRKMLKTIFFTELFANFIRGGFVMIGLLGFATSAATAGEVVVEASPLEQHEACQASPHAVLLTIGNVRNDQGLLIASLYKDDEENFMKKAARLDRMRVETQKGVNKVCLQAPGPGKYAVVIFHDEDRSGKISQGFLGIPKEGFGFSGNPTLFGRPEFTDAAFKMNGAPREFEIELTYLSGSSQTAERK